MNPSSRSIPKELLAILGLHVFALHTAAEELAKRTGYSKQKWLELLQGAGMSRYESTPPHEFHPLLMEALNAARASINDEASPPASSPQQP
jgi:hypothetical protein